MNVDPSGKLFLEILAVVTVLVSIICYSGYVEKNVWEPNCKLLESQQSHSDKVLFYDTLFDTLTFRDTVIDVKNMEDHVFSDFLYLYGDNIYFRGRSDDDKHNYAVYKVDLQLRNITEVLNGGSSYVMPNEYTVIFEKDDSGTKYVYYISENKTEPYSGDMSSLQNQVSLKTYSNDYYTFEKHTEEHIFRATEFSFTITDKATG